VKQKLVLQWWDLGIFVSETCGESEMCGVGAKHLYGWCRRNVLNLIVEMPVSNLGLETVFVCVCVVFFF